MTVSAARSDASSRLVVVSNRVPYDAETPGGLAVALGDALAARDTLWFGWSGQIEENAAETVSTVRRGKVEYAVTPLSAAEHAGYYAGYANTALWPSFHYRLDLAEYDAGQFDAYMAVNARFARLLAGRIGPRDQIWIHDYHLIPLAHELRQLGVQNRIGFFSHIPFPSPEIFRAIPQHAALVRGLTACDLVGFQSEGDRANFERHLTETGRGPWTADGALDPAARLTRVKAFPIGIDAAGFARDAAASAGRGQAAVGARGRRLVLGVDRMDYSKGLIERVQAVETLFETRPDLREQASFIQLTPPSRGEVDAYARLRTELETAIGHVNGRFSTLDWAPVRYIAQGLPRDELAGLYRDAHVGLVTPLRDGMNLVAKEFVAAQDPDDPGVLVLSEFAGAAEQLPQALIVNPHDPRQQADAVARALAMDLAERRERHAAMMDTLARRDASWWCAAFLRELDRCEGTNPEAAAATESPAIPEAQRMQTPHWPGGASPALAAVAV